MAILAHLPEVERVSARDDRGIVDIAWIRLELADGSTIVIFGLREDGYRCRRTRLSDGDYSDRPAIETIPEDMRERLVAIFGPLRFDPEADRP
jgi:hypothetical protein